MTDFFLISLLPLFLQHFHSFWWHQHVSIFCGWGHFL